MAEGRWSLKSGTVERLQERQVALTRWLDERFLQPKDAAALLAILYVTCCGGDAARVLQGVTVAMKHYAQHVAEGRG